jgi:hypothetical protein
MKVEEKKYLLASQSGANICKNDNLVLGINGIRTAINLKDFFVEYNQTEKEILGYSPFFDKDIEDYKIKYSENILISFFNKNTDEEIFVKQIKTPFFQGRDIEMDLNPLNVVILDAYKSITIAEGASEEAEIEENLIGEEVIELLKEEGLTEEDLNEVEEEQEIREEKETEGLKKYNIDKEELLNDGFVECTVWKNDKLLKLLFKNSAPKKVLLVDVGLYDYKKIGLKIIKENGAKITFNTGLIYDSELNKVINI